jgi:hypothetical protein
MTPQFAPSHEGQDSNLPNQTTCAGLMRNPGIVLLRDARECARDTGLDAWQFAVEIDGLRSTGLTNTELRWLVSRGLSEHRCEQTRAGDRIRRFRKSPPGSLALSQRDCFILTEAGYEFASKCGSREAAHAGQSNPTDSLNLSRPSRGGGQPPATSPATSSTRAAPPNRRTWIPSWDAMLHELRLGRWIVKRFSRPARAQETILSAFQEEGWPAAIDDPLPARFNQDPKRRLHYTVRNLNRGQHPLRIRFFINGNGETIHWKLVLPQPPKAVAVRRGQ